MIFGGKRYEDQYRLWFAWRPVKLYGPDEWRRDRKPRWVWLQLIQRMRCKPHNYYALLEDDDDN